MHPRCWSPSHRTQTGWVLFNTHGCFLRGVCGVRPWKAAEEEMEEAQPSTEGL